jgi:hypothetical protein
VAAGPLARSDDPLPAVCAVRTPTARRRARTPKKQPDGSTATTHRRRSHACIVPERHQVTGPVAVRLTLQGREPASPSDNAPLRPVEDVDVARGGRDATLPGGCTSSPSDDSLGLGPSAQRGSSSSVRAIRGSLRCAGWGKN